LVLAGVAFLSAHVVWCIQQSRVTGVAAYMPGVVLLAAAPADPAAPITPPATASADQKWWLEIHHRYGAEATAWVLRPMSGISRWAFRVGLVRVVRRSTTANGQYDAAFLLGQVDKHAPEHFEGDKRGLVIAACSDAVYATCSSYQDIALHKGNIGVRDETLGYTAFRRPGRFRFEYLSEHPMQRAFTIRGVIWQDRGEVSQWWSIRPGVEKSATLGMPLSAFTGVSSSLAATVPFRLLGGNWRGAGQTTLHGDDVFDGRACYHIRTSLSGYIDDLWIDKETYAILRIERSGMLHDVTVYRPRFGAAMSDETFSFDPSQPAKTPLGDGEKACDELRPLIGERRSGG
jgi:hypothetical protein